MHPNERIKYLITKLVNKASTPFQTLVAKVDSVDEAEFTCVLNDEGFIIRDVRLRPVLNGKEGITIFPKVGSYAFCLRIGVDDEWLLIAADEISKYRIVAGTTTFETDGEKFEVRSDDVSLKDILNDLITEVIAIYAPKNVANLTAIQTKTLQLLK